MILAAALGLSGALTAALGSVALSYTLEARAGRPAKPTISTGRYARIRGLAIALLVAGSLAVLVAVALLLGGEA